MTFAGVVALLSVAIYYSLKPDGWEYDKDGHVVIGSSVPVMRMVRFVNMVMDPMKRQFVHLDDASIHSLVFEKWENLSAFVGSELVDPKAYQFVLQSDTTFVGRFAMQNDIATGLAVQWKINQIVHMHPEILQERIEAPLILTGLPRSGTTYFHQVLADSGMGLRFPKFYEAGMPIPLQPTPPEDVGTLRDSRTVGATEVLGITSKLFPSMPLLHEFGNFDEPEEEVVWMSFAFNTCLNSAKSVDLKFIEYTPGRDMQRLKYTLLKRVLQVMQWQHFQASGKRPRWLLKSPEHLLAPEEFVAAFPDAKIVLVERDPLPVYKSLVIFKHHTSGTTHSKPSVEASNLYAKLNMCAMLKGFEKLSQLPANTTMKVSFKEVMSMPITVAENVASFAGLPWSKRVVANLEESVQHRSNRWKQRGKIIYRMADFGLDDDKIRDCIAQCRLQHE